MAKEGQHEAQVRVKGDTRNASKEAKLLAKRVEELERELARTDDRMGKFTIALDKKTSAAKKASGADEILTGALRKVGEMGVEFAKGAALDVARSLATITTDTIASARELDNWSKKMGESTQNLQVLDGVAELANVPIDNLREGVLTLRENLGEMSRLGTGPAVDSLKTLGLSLDQIDGRPAEEQLKIFATALAGLPSEAQRTSVALEIMGDDGKQLLPILKLGAEGIDQFAERAREAGGIMSDETVAASVELAEKTKELELRYKALRTEIASEIIPAANEWADRLELLEKNTLGLIDAQDELTDSQEETLSVTENLIPPFDKLTSSFFLLKINIDAYNETMTTVADRMRDRLNEAAVEQEEKINNLRAAYASANEQLRIMGRLQAEAAAQISIGAIRSAEELGMVPHAGLQEVDVQDTSKGPGRKRGRRRRRNKEEGEEIGDFTARGREGSLASQFADLEGKTKEDIELRQTTSTQIQQIEADLDQAQEDNHQRALARIDEIRAKEKEKLETTIMVAEATGSVLAQSGAIAQQAASAFIVNEERRKKASFGIAATQAFIIGTLEVVRAASAFASFNYVGGALHTAAAAFAFARGGMLAAQARGKGVSFRGAAGGDPSVGASTQAANGPPPSISTGTRTESPVPPSAAPDDPSTRDNGNRRDETPAGGNAVNFNGPVHLYGTPKEDFLLATQRGLDRLPRNHRRAS